MGRGGTCKSLHRRMVTVVIEPCLGLMLFKADRRQSFTQGHYPPIYQGVISNGNRTQWSPIRSVIKE